MSRDGDSGFFDSIKSNLSRTENTDEEKLEKLKKRKAELEKKYKMKKMQRDIQKYKGEVEGRGTFGKLGAVVKDISKRGKPGQDSAISILVGPPEGQESTEEFVLGNSPSKRSEDVSSFILGSNHEDEEKDRPWYEQGLV